MLTIECTVKKCEYHRTIHTHAYRYDIPKKNRYKKKEKGLSEKG